MLSPTSPLTSKTIQKSVLCLFLLVTASSPALTWASESEVSISARLVPPSTFFRVGEIFDLEVDLSYPADGPPLIAEQNPILHLPEQLELVGSASGRQAKNEAGSVTNRFFFRYSIRGIEPNEEKRNRIASLLEECESLRYSPGVPPSHELDRIERRAREILKS